MTATPLRVVDVSQGWAGPMVGYMLAAFGAEVIKVESARYFDWWRGSPHPDAVPGDNRYEMTPTHNSVNRSKLAVNIDLQIPEGLALLNELLAESDVFVENYPPRVMPRLGLAPKKVLADHPHLVMISLPAFGASGPEMDYVGFGNTIEAMAGITLLNGYPDGSPIQNPNAYGDPASGIMGAFAVLTALHERDNLSPADVSAAGQPAGRHIELSELEATIPHAANRLLEFPATGRNPERTGTRHPTMAPHGVYPCQPIDDIERFIVIACRDDDDWANLRTALGDPTWAQADNLRTVDGRHAAHDDIDFHLAAWTAPRSHIEAMHHLQAHHVPAGAALSNYDVLFDEHLTERGFHIPVDHPVMGTSLYPAPGVRLSKSPVTADRPAPLLGQHTEEVLQRVLHKTDQQLADLETLGVTTRAFLREG
jgi:crotonobetainyl-CoA:carnitine CoA-transferase CaiB-like acyl-CoA transferase